ncbi:MAG: hypothetical protein AAFN30_05835 [Actinomycetota bacterium]
MELDSQTLSSFVLGVAVGVLLFMALFLLARRRLRLSNRAQIEQYEQTILDLRQERAEGRETNRRLRHELAISTPEHLESTRLELAEANEREADLQARLTEADVQLSVRDRSLREARLAIQEIRLQLEEGRFGEASAHSAEYLDHGIDPNEMLTDVQPVLRPDLRQFLDDGVVVAGDDEPAEPETATERESASADGSEATTTDGGSAEDGDDEILVGDAGPGEPVS